MRVPARSSGRNAHIRSSTVVYVIKNNDRKKLSETCTNPEVRFLAQKYSVIRPKFFFETLSMLSMRIKLFNSVNNSECMKQHCTAPLRYFRWKPGGLWLPSKLHCQGPEKYERHRQNSPSAIRRAIWILWCNRAGRYGKKNYHDKCQIFISFKIKDRFLLQSESCRNQTINFPQQNKYLTRKINFLVSAWSNEWYCFKSRNRFGLPDNINNNNPFFLSLRNAHLIVAWVWMQRYICVQYQNQ